MCKCVFLLPLQIKATSAIEAKRTTCFLGVHTPWLHLSSIPGLILVCFVCAYDSITSSRVFGTQRWSAGLSAWARPFVCPLCAPHSMWLVWSCDCHPIYVPMECQPQKFHQKRKLSCSSSFVNCSQVGRVLIHFITRGMSYSNRVIPSVSITSSEAMNSWSWMSEPTRWVQKARQVNDTLALFQQHQGQWTRQRVKKEVRQSRELRFIVTALRRHESDVLH